MSSLGTRLAREASRVAAALKQRDLGLVLAESCTGGMVAASLAGVPGVSANLCGSAVVYREDTKARWIGVSRALLAKRGAVSREVAIAMARGVLKRTPEAQLAAAITGHLGPNAPRRQDGLVYVAICAGKKACWSEELWILPHGKNPDLRRQRQLLASHAVLVMLRSVLQTTT